MDGRFVWHGLHVLDRVVLSGGTRVKYLGAVRVAGRTVWPSPACPGISRVWAQAADSRSKPCPGGGYEKQGTLKSSCTSCRSHQSDVTNKLRAVANPRPVTGGRESARLHRSRARDPRRLTERCSLSCAMPHGTTEPARGVMYPTPRHPTLRLPTTPRSCRRLPGTT